MRSGLRVISIRPGDSSSQVLACRYASVFKMPSRIVSVGVQPNDRIFVQSSRMNGLSPIQPRSPPEYVCSGVMPSASQM